MMFKTITTKTLYDKRWMMLAWGLGVFLLFGFTVILFPDFGKNEALVEQYKQLPETLQALTGPLDINTIEKYVDSQVFYNNASFLLVILGISFGVNALATEEDKRTLETILATPISKTRFYSEKFLSAIIIFAIVNLFGFLAILLGIAVISESLSFLKLFQAVINLWIYTILFGALSLSFGGITGKKNLAIAIPTVIFIVMFFIYTFSQSVDWMKGWDRWTWNYYYSNPKVLINGINYGDLLILITSIVILFLAGLYFFNKRDINV